MLNLMQTASELGLICSLTVLALFLSYRMLNVCDLSTDGCFTLGAVVGAVTAIAGHPFLSLCAAITAGICSGFITALLQTRCGLNSLLAGIIVNTGLYSVNIGLMGGASMLNMNKTPTVFTFAATTLQNTPLQAFSKLLCALIFVALCLSTLLLFLRTRLGLAIRATGNNPDCVRASSINPVMTTTVGLCLSNGLTALSGCLLAQSQKAVDINLGSGMVTIALASLLIGKTLFSKGGMTMQAIGAVAGAIIFRLIYGFALRMHMPAFMLKLVSSLIVALTLALPYVRSMLPQWRRQWAYRREGRQC